MGNTYVRRVQPSVFTRSLRMGCFAFQTWKNLRRCSQENEPNGLSITYYFRIPANIETDFIFVKQKYPLSYLSILFPIRNMWVVLLVPTATFTIMFTEKQINLFNQTKLAKYTNKWIYGTNFLKYTQYTRNNFRRIIYLSSPIPRMTPESWNTEIRGNVHC